MNHQTQLLTRPAHRQVPRVSTGKTVHLTHQEKVPTVVPLSTEEVFKARSYRNKPLGTMLHAPPDDSFTSDAQRRVKSADPLSIFVPLGVHRLLPHQKNDEGVAALSALGAYRRNVLAVPTSESTPEWVPCFVSDVLLGGILPVSFFTEVREKLDFTQPTVSTSYDSLSCFTVASFSTLKVANHLVPEKRVFYNCVFYTALQFYAHVCSRWLFAPDSTTPLLLLLKKNDLTTGCGMHSVLLQEKKLSVEIEQLYGEGGGDVLSFVEAVRRVPFAVFFVWCWHQLLRLRDEHCERAGVPNTLAGDLTKQRPDAPSWSFLTQQFVSVSLSTAQPGVETRLHAQQSDTAGMHAPLRLYHGCCFLTSTFFQPHFCVLNRHWRQVWVYPLRGPERECQQAVNERHLKAVEFFAQLLLIESRPSVVDGLARSAMHQLMRISQMDKFGGELEDHRRAPNTFTALKEDGQIKFAIRKDNSLRLHFAQPALLDAIRLPQPAVKESDAVDDTLFLFPSFSMLCYDAPRRLSLGGLEARLAETERRLSQLGADEDGAPVEEALQQLRQQKQHLVENPLPPVHPDEVCDPEASTFVDPLRVPRPSCWLVPDRDAAWVTGLLLNGALHQLSAELPPHCPVVFFTVPDGDQAALEHFGTAYFALWSSCRTETLFWRALFECWQQKWHPDQPPLNPLHYTYTWTSATVHEMLVWLDHHLLAYHLVLRHKVLAIEKRAGLTTELNENSQCLLYRYRTRVLRRCTMCPFTYEARCLFEGSEALEAVYRCAEELLLKDEESIRCLYSTLQGADPLSASEVEQIQLFGKAYLCLGEESSQVFPPVAVRYIHAFVYPLLVQWVFFASPSARFKLTEDTYWPQYGVAAAEKNDVAATGEPLKKQRKRKSGLVASHLAPEAAAVYQRLKKQKKISQPQSVMRLINKALKVVRVGLRSVVLPTLPPDDDETSPSRPLFTPASQVEASLGLSVALEKLADPQLGEERAQWESIRQHCLSVLNPGLNQDASSSSSSSSPSFSSPSFSSSAETSASDALFSWQSLARLKLMGNYLLEVKKAGLLVVNDFFQIVSRCGLSLAFPDLEAVMRNLAQFASLRVERVLPAHRLLHGTVHRVLDAVTSAGSGHPALDGFTQLCQRHLKRYHAPSVARCPLNNEGVVAFCSEHDAMVERKDYAYHPDTHVLTLNIFIVDTEGPTPAALSSLLCCGTTPGPDGAASVAPSITQLMRETLTGLDAPFSGGGSVVSRLDLLSHM